MKVKKQNSEIKIRNNDSDSLSGIIRECNSAQKRRQSVLPR